MNWFDSILDRPIRDVLWMTPAAGVAVLQLLLQLPIQIPRKINGDPALFMYGGNLFHHGYAPYLHLWDIKPPMIYLTTGGIAFFAPESPWIQYYIGAFLMSLAVVIAVLCVSYIVYQETGDEVAGALAGVGMASYPILLFLPVLGIVVEPFVLAFGFASLVFLQQSRYIVAAILSVISAGFWQFGIIFFAIVFWYAWRDKDHRRVFTAAVGTTAIVFIPFVVTGSAVSMVVEVTLGLFGHTESLNLISRVEKMISIMRFDALIVVSGIIATGWLVHQNRAPAWLLPLLIWVIIQPLFLDLDRGPDLLLLTSTAPIGLGIAFAHVSVRTKWILSVLVLGVGLVMLAGAHGWFVNPRPPGPGESIRHQHFLQQMYPPEDCFLGDGFKQQRWVELTGGSLDQKRCGTRLPF